MGCTGAASFNGVPGIPPALIADANFYGLVGCRMVTLSLEQGNSDGSCYGYMTFGLIAGPHFGNYQAGFRFGKLGYDLVEERGLHRYQSHTYMGFGGVITPWSRHIKTGRELLGRSFDAANRIGSLITSAACGNILATNFLVAGDPLAATLLSSSCNTPQVLCKVEICFTREAS